MRKEEYIKIVKEKISNIESQKIFVNQINKYYDIKSNYIAKENKYSIGDRVLLSKGTLLHGTYKNLDGLKEIVKNGLISSWFIDGKGSKYPSSVGVWNLKQDYYLKDYINFYSGGTVRYFNHLNDESETEVLSFNEVSNIMTKVKEKGYLAWKMEQTKESRFLPSLAQNIVQIGIIFNGNNPSSVSLLEGDILDQNNISDKAVKEFVNEWYYDKFIIDRKNKDDFFTDRESAILFGIPSNLIEGILVGRKYEGDDKILKEIKSMLPNCYICNLDGRVIM